MTKPGSKKPRGKPFKKGKDERRVLPTPGRREQRANEFTREMKACLLGAAEDAGNRMVAVSNARLPKKPDKVFTRELIEFLRQDPKGMQSYFLWLAEQHPSIFAALLGRALPNIMQHESGDGGIEVVYRSAEDIEAALKARNLPPLKHVFQLPKRIDLNNPPTIDVTPEP